MKRKTRIGLWIGLGAAAAALLAAGMVVFFVFAPLQGTLTPRDTRVLVLTGTDVPDAAALAPFSELETLDLTGTTANAAQVAALRTAYPRLHMIWQVPLSGGAVSSDAEQVCLQTAADVAQLPYFQTLKTVKAEPEAVCPALLEAMAARPDCVFSYQVSLCGQLIDGDASEAVLDGRTADAAQILDALRYLPKLGTVTLTDGLPDRTVVREMLAQRPELRLLWTDPLFAASDSATEAVLIDAACGDAEALADYLSCLPRLKSADLRRCPLTNADAAALALRFAEATLLWTVDVDGVKADSTAERLSWENVPIEDYAAFGDALAYLPALRRVEMEGCGLTDAQLFALCDRYPGVLFVWTLHIRSRWTVRTDAKAFSTMQGGGNNRRLWSEDVQVLRYCRELVALDLGHNSITDLSWISSLTELQVLILGDNPIQDLSPLKSLKKLKYLEAFMTQVSDISAVSELPELLDFNLCYSRVSDASPLLACKKLERIWLAACKSLTDTSIQQLREAFPDAKLNVFPGGGSTAWGWREHDRYFACVEMFKTGQPVAPFLP